MEKGGYREGKKSIRKSSRREKEIIFPNSKNRERDLFIEDTHI